MSSHVLHHACTLSVAPTDDSDCASLIEFDSCFTASCPFILFERCCGHHVGPVGSPGSHCGSVRTGFIHISIIFGSKLDPMKVLVC